MIILFCIILAQIPQNTTSIKNPEEFLKHIQDMRPLSHGYTREVERSEAKAIAGLLRHAIFTEDPLVWKKVVTKIQQNPDLNPWAILGFLASFTASDFEKNNQIQDRYCQIQQLSSFQSETISENLAIQQLEMNTIQEYSEILLDRVIKQNQLKRSVLLIGNNHYNNRPNLAYAQSDVYLLAESFSKLPQTAIKLLVGGDVTSENIVNAIKDLGKKANQGNLEELIIYFSGHGFKSSSGSIFYVTGEGEELSLAQALGDLSGFKGDAFLLFDACLTQSEPTKPVIISPPFPQITLITSTGNNQPATEHAAYFSSFFVKGLTSALEELGYPVSLEWKKVFEKTQFITSEISGRLGPTQVPQWREDYFKRLVNDSRHPNSNPGPFPSLELFQSGHFNGSLYPLNSMNPLSPLDTLKYTNSGSPPLP